MIASLLPRRARRAVSAIVLLVVASCGGDAGLSFDRPDDEVGPTVSGQVQLPNGDLARRPSLMRRLASFVVQRARALVADNLAPAGPNIPVFLFDIASNDVVDGEIRTGDVVFEGGTDHSGRYAVELHARTDENTCRYLLQIGSQNDGTLTRAFVFSTSEPIDINLQSEAAVRLILAEIGAGRADLCDFSAAEIAAIYAAIDQSPAVVTGDTVEELNASAEVAAAGDPGVQNAIAAAIDQPPPPSPTATDTPVAVPSMTATPTSTRTATRAAENTFTVTASRTATQARTTTPTERPTRTFPIEMTNTPTATPVSTSTATPTETRATPTDTPETTATETETPVATATETETSVATQTETPTGTPTSTPTPSPTQPSTPTRSSPFTVTRTATPPATPTPTTDGTTPTGTATVPATATATATRTSTPTSPPPSSATPTVTATPTLGVAPEVNIGLFGAPPGALAGTAGATLSVPVSLLTNGASIAAVSNDIVYDASVLDVEMVQGVPDCSVAPALAGTKQIVARVAALDGTSKRLRVGLLGRDDQDELSDGNLYHCRFRIDLGVAAGSTALQNQPAASSPSGAAVAVTGASGNVAIAAAGATLALGTGTAAAGGMVDVVASLQPNGAELSAVATDIRFDPALLDVVEDGGVPDCTADDAIGAGSELRKEVFAALREADGSETRVLRVGLAARENNTPLPDSGAAVAVFRCRFMVAAGSGTIVLDHAPSGSDPSGLEVGVSGAPGTIVVE
jgi:hypothetical protein